MSAAEQLQAEFSAKIAQATATAAARRDAAWLCAPWDICGLTLRDLNLRDYLTLIVAGNAYVAPAQPPEDEAGQLRFWAAHNAQFLWLLSPDYRVNDTRALNRFINKIADLKFEAIMAGIHAYLAETFADTRRGAGAGPDPTQADPLRVSFFSCYVHRLASAYGWPISEIEKLPLKQVFQLIRLLDAEAAYKAGKQPAALVDETDELWAQYLARLNTSAAA
jgi:hypothetical protein